VTTKQPQIVGYEIVWKNSLGEDQRMLCMDRDRAVIYAARYNGVVYPLARVAQ
jgi:hypothetical protein